MVDASRGTICRARTGYKLHFAASIVAESDTLEAVLAQLRLCTVQNGCRQYEWSGVVNRMGEVRPRLKTSVVSMRMSIARLTIGWMTRNESPLA
jgi:hypothetical protein